MEKNTIIIISFCAFSLFANAQRDVGKLYLCPRIGINFSNYNGSYNSGSLETLEGDKTKSKYKIGYIAGVELCQQISGLLNASIGLMYALEGEKRTDGIYEYGDRKNITKEFSTNLHYLNIPIMLGLDVIKFGNSCVSIKAGCQAGLRLKAEAKNSLDKYVKKDGVWVLSESSEAGCHNVNDIYKFINISIPIGLEYSYKNYVMDFRYDFGVTKINKYSDGIRQGCFSLTMKYYINK